LESTFKKGRAKIKGFFAKLYKKEMSQRAKKKGLIQTFINFQKNIFKKKKVSIKAVFLALWLILGSFLLYII